MTQDPFDIACLRGIATDADAKRIALAAAMIRMLALTMAREAPQLRDEALQIVDHARQLYHAMPTRNSIAAVLESFPGTGPAVGDRHNMARRDELVEALWQHFQVGQSTAPRPPVARDERGPGRASPT